MMVEGRVIIDLPRHPGGAVAVDFRQPGNVGRLLAEKTPDEVMDIVPALYSVCGTAQAHAAVTALEGALGVSVSPRTLAARAALTAMESLREHALRIALDWPGFVEAAPQGGAFRPAMQFVRRLGTALFGQARPIALGQEAEPDIAAAVAFVDEARSLLEAEIFGEALETWLKRRGFGEVLDWARHSQTVAGRLVLRLAEAGRFDAAEADSAPLRLPVNGALQDWMKQADGAIAVPPPPGMSIVPEASIHVRRACDPLVTSLGGAGLGARMVARLVELARLPGEIHDLITGGRTGPGAIRSGGDAAIGAVEAARGLLVHAVRLENGRVAAYHVVSPTRWNFDRQGIAARCLSKLDCEDEGERLDLARLVVNAIDPCVAYEVRMH